MINLGGATENDRKKIVITKDSKAFFHNNVDYCVGTGRMGLALTEEYQEELRLVQKSSDMYQNLVIENSLFLAVSELRLRFA